MTFEYLPYDVEPTPYDLSTSIIFRPVIPVYAIGSESEFGLRAIVDTGADESLITASVASELGVQPVSSDRFRIDTAAGQMQAWYGEITIKVSDGEETFVRRIVVGVVAEDWNEMILGQRGFLEYFNATFSHAHRTLILTPAY